MVIATLLYKREYMEVEVLDVYPTEYGKRAAVEALIGEPFTALTHGGPMATSYLIVRADSLRDIRIENKMGAVIG